MLYVLLKSLFFWVGDWVEFISTQSLFLGLNMSLQTYRLFLEQADSQFERVHATHESQFQCRAGCHACCQAGLTVSAIERENI